MYNQYTITPHPRVVQISFLIHYIPCGKCGTLPISTGLNVKMKSQCSVGSLLESLFLYRSLMRHRDAVVQSAQPIYSGQLQILDCLSATLIYIYLRCFQSSWNTLSEQSVIPFLGERDDEKLLEDTFSSGNIYNNLSLWTPHDVHVASEALTAAS